MKIWLVTVGENIPTNNDRLCRTAILSDMLSQTDHEVLRWTSTFDHQTKRYLYSENTKIKVSNNLTRIFLHSKTPYYKNISFSRIKNHREVAVNFEIEARKVDKPDIIFCSFPTIELGYSTIMYGKENDIPVIIDVRDLWPEIFLNIVPNFFRPVMKVLLRHYIAKTKFVFRHAYGITGISEKYLEFGLKNAKRDRCKKDGIFPLGYDNRIIDKVSNDQIDFGHIKIDKNLINIWFVGTFGSTYDLTTVIKAAKKLQISHPRVSFIFTGNGDNMNKWKLQSKDISNVVFTGWVGKNELRYIASNSKIGLMAYSKGAPQGLPNKVFEYMAFGLPIISSLQNESKDILANEDIGLTYLPGDSDDFLSKITAMVNNATELRKMGVRSREVYDANYSVEIVYNNLVKYLEMVIDK